MTSNNSQKLHKRKNLLSASLSSDLKDDYGFRSLPVREGDKVRLLRGDFTGVEGRITEVDAKNQRITVEGVETAKTDESEVPTPVHPSNVEITEIEKDPAREKIIERRSKIGEKRRKETSEETERPESSEGE